MLVQMATQTAAVVIRRLTALLDRPNRAIQPPLIGFAPWLAPSLATSRPAVKREREDGN
jgi:hypothetical protein